MDIVFKTFSFAKDAIYMSVSYNNIIIIIMIIIIIHCNNNSRPLFMNNIIFYLFAVHICKCLKDKSKTESDFEICF